MPVRGIDGGRSSPRALESAPITSGFTFEVPVEHGHMTESQIFNGLQPLSSLVENITGITDESITAKNTPVAVASLLKEFSGMFETRQIIRSIVSKENLLGLYNELCKRGKDKEYTVSWNRLSMKG